MSGLKATKRRIVSAKNTQKVTRAMKLVSSAKYARACNHIANADHYAKSIDSTLFHLVPFLDSQASSLTLTKKRAEKKVLLIVVSSDRGLCGALNTNILKLAQSFTAEKAEEGVHCDLYLWGRKSHTLAHRLGNALDIQQRVLDKPSFSFCKKAFLEFASEFKSGRWDAVYVVYSKFKNAISQESKVKKLLPFDYASILVNAGEKESNPCMEVEPSTPDFLEEILEAKVSDMLFRILLESSASEHAARMTAMENATNNADEVISDLTLEYNRARQAAITKELIEITSGAEAL